MNGNSRAKQWLWVWVLAGLLVGVRASAEEKPATLAPPAAPVIVVPSELSWSGNAKLHGLQTAPLAGDSKAPAPYAERIKLPPHYTLPPHSHPNEARMVTVISGTFYYAFGETFDEKKLRLLPPGSFFTEPKDMYHFAQTKDEEVILQLNAIGPAGTKYMDARNAGVAR